jgi:hypothetical protein
MATLFIVTVVGPAIDKEDIGGHERRVLLVSTSVDSIGITHNACLPSAGPAQGAKIR